jgi:hypothetical protein
LGRGTHDSEDLGSLAVSALFPIRPSTGVNERFSLATGFGFGGSLMADVDPVSLLPRREFVFAGSGTATATFSSFVFVPGKRDLFFEGGTFDFGAPVPEPASFVLLATGLGGLLIGTTSHRKR